MAESVDGVGRTIPSTADVGTNSGTDRERGTEFGSVATKSPMGPSSQTTMGDDELDDFGLPAAKIVVNSRPTSSCAESFASARSSIDEANDERGDCLNSKEDDEVADVEDNGQDIERDISNVTIEWPRLSKSTLPGAGHVKSSPFHATSPKPSDKSTEYAERAKDLIRVSPVSTSIFKIRDSPLAESPLPITPVSPITASSPQNARENLDNEGVQSNSPQDVPTASSTRITQKESIAGDDSKRSNEQKRKSTSKPTDISHSRNISTKSVTFDDPEADSNPSGASEWSHQQAVIQRESHDKARKSNETDGDGWQTMEAYAAYDLYDDDGRMIAKQWSLSDDESQAKGGAGKGYTRMNQDEDAQSADSMDENTDYLFKETLDDEDAKTPLSQMQATKELLTEGQRIAYVGLCKLTMVGMLRDVARVKFKESRAAYESMTLWSQKMMIRLFSHMDISPDGCQHRETANIRASHD
jgi:hypothetical protein